MRALPTLLAAVVLGLGPFALAGPPPDIERELEEAKALYREARFAQALTKLQAVVSRIEQLRDAQARKLPLADAHLHLALSYVALNDPSAAKQSLKAMLHADPAKRLDPQVYAPKVMELFEQARAAVAREPTAAAASSPVRKKGSKTLPILLGVGAAAAGGAALALGGGATEPTESELEYVVSGGQDPSGPIYVDWRLQLFVNGSPVYDMTQGGRCCAPVPSARFQARPGGTLRVLATDDPAGNCYSLEPLFLQRADGTRLTQLNEHVSSPSCETELLPEVFFDRTYTLP